MSGYPDCRPSHALPALGARWPYPQMHVSATSASACYAGDLSVGFDQPVWLPVVGAGGIEMSGVDPCLIDFRAPSRRPPERLSLSLVDDYLEFLEGRCRTNTVLAVRSDLRIFFAVVGKPAVEVVAADVLGFITAQRTGRDSLDPVQPVDRADASIGVAVSTVARRLSTISGFFAYL